MTQSIKSFNRREILAGLGGVLPAMSLSCAVPKRDRASRNGRTNIVLIFADDMGYGDAGCYGAEKIKTPNLDRMALEGMRYTSFYSCASVCTPSRAGLLTGRYPIRSGMTRVLFPYSKGGIEDSEITLAEALKRCGYTTCCIGKWHLGHLPPYLPTRHGFDTYFGLPYSNDMHSKKRGDPPVPLMRDEEIIEQPVNQNTLTRRYADEAVRFISSNKDRPFFLYLPHTMPHIPLHVSKAFEGKSAGGLYGDVIEEIDWSVGRILSALERHGLDDNTLVIFTSDNGPWLVMKEHGGSAGILRHGKGTTFEGGVREPCIMRWPGRIEAGRVYGGPAITLDLFPTLVRLAGGEIPQDRIIDGRDIRGILFGASKPAEEEFFFYRQEELQAYRSGRWKIKKPFKGKIYGEPLEHPWLLFDLYNDPSESDNLAEKHPEILKRMQTRMEEFRRNAASTASKTKT